MSNNRNLSFSLITELLAFSLLYFVNYVSVLVCTKSKRKGIRRHEKKITRSVREVARKKSTTSETSGYVVEQFHSICFIRKYQLPFRCLYSDILLLFFPDVIPTS